MCAVVCVTVSVTLHSEAMLAFLKQSSRLHQDAGGKIIVRRTQWIVL